MKVYGLDPDGDALIELSCGHQVSFPVQLFNQSLDYKGAALRCPEGCVTEYVETEWVHEILSELQR